MSALHKLTSSLGRRKARQSPSRAAPADVYAQPDATGGLPLNPAASPTPAASQNYHSSNPAAHAQPVDTRSSRSRSRTARPSRIAHRPPPDAPRPKPTLLQCGLPQTVRTDVAEVLRESSRYITASRGDAAREKVEVALRAGRTPHLDSLLSEYIPYSCACVDIADTLRSRGKLHDREPFQWKSALAPSPSSEVVRGDFALELCFVVSAAAQLRINVALSSDGYTLLSSTEKSQLLSASKDLQVAAGMFTWLVDTGIPKALESLRSPPPPELDQDVARAMGELCLALSQCLVARNAELSGFPPRSLVKLVLGAQDLSVRASDAAKSCRGAVTEALYDAGVEMALFMRAWSQAILAKEADDHGRAGEKLGRIRLACQDMQSLAQRGGLVRSLAEREFHKYSETFFEYDADARRLIEPEALPETLGTANMEFKVIAKGSSYEPPKAKAVNKKNKNGGAGDAERRDQRG